MGLVLFPGDGNVTSPGLSWSYTGFNVFRGVAGPGGVTHGRLLGGCPAHSPHARARVLPTGHRSTSTTSPTVFCEPEPEQMDWQRWRGLKDLVVFAATRDERNRIAVAAPNGVRIVVLGQPGS
ncbi:hypothetical protein Shyhy02_30180 [Streptomyces hygroscopicus subsp. hygroscopicus]|nr:hypothetical protein Shyhy02_30180 [Streptomyces hygroscopicus subsp. hygroscopicus]